MIDYMLICPSRKLRKNDTLALEVHFHGLATLLSYRWDVFDSNPWFGATVASWAS